MAVHTPAAGKAFVGRRRELDLLLDQLGPTGSAVSFVTGVAGIGKSALLSRFAAAAVERGCSAIELDCRTIEPTQQGFLAALGQALDVPEPGSTLKQVVARLALGRPVLLALDNYEVFRLVDSWLRQELVPVLPADVRLVIAGREPPVARWLATVDPLVLVLGPLRHGEAVDLLGALEVPEELAERVAELVRGYPLALALAASTARARPDLGPEDIATHRAVDELAGLYLEGVDDPLTREAIEAASVLRRVNVGLMEALLPEVSGRESYERLRALPFIESRHDGLVLHEAVRDAIAASLQAADPVRYREYRRRGWRRLRAELREVGSAGLRRDSAELWRYSGDMVYIFGNPAVREAYFPSGAQSVAVEPARPDDWPAVARIAARHLGEEEERLVERWWQEAPHTFVVGRDRDSLVIAFLIFVDGKSIVPLAVPEDPVVRQWADDLRAEPLARGQLAQGLRLWLDVDHADAPCAAQAAGFLDCKRSYMALRPHLARMYLAMRDAPTYQPLLEQLEFRMLEAGPAEVGSVAYTTGRLDFGAGSVDGWLARLVAAELALDEESPLDESSQEIAIDGYRVPLTRLEFGVVASLDQRAGRAVSRRQLIEEVWGYEYVGGSNIVDSVVRSLRRKLGQNASLVETVRGIGYRLPQGWETQLR
jgi:AAA ATPase domain